MRPSHGGRRSTNSGCVVTAHWSEWIGRTETAREEATLAPAQALAATLDREDPSLARGDMIPGLWAWLYFTPRAPMREIGSDGHPQRGGFLPPIPAPRRMWAGSRCKFMAPLRLGAALERVSTITAITEKAGRAATLTFLTIRHVVAADGVPVLEEEQDLVFLPIPDAWEPPAKTSAPKLAWAHPVPITPILLFRFSALTFNSHRIHYDRAYAMEVEKYPGLVVHGPLQAILMFEAAQRREPRRRPAWFEFRGVRPLFDFDAVRVGGAPREDGGLDLFTLNAEDAVGARAVIAFGD